MLGPKFTRKYALIPVFCVFILLRVHSSACSFFCVFILLRVHFFFSYSFFHLFFTLTFGVVTGIGNGSYRFWAIQSQEYPAGLTKSENLEEGKQNLLCCG